MKTRCGRTEDVKVGLHHGSALLFIIIMDVLAEKARTNQSWAMIFADNLALVSETVESRYREHVSANNLLGSSKLCRPLTYTTDTLTTRAKITIIIAICNDKKIKSRWCTTVVNHKSGNIPGNIGPGEHRFGEHRFGEH